MSKMEKRRNYIDNTCEWTSPGHRAKLSQTKGNTG